MGSLNLDLLHLSLVYELQRVWCMSCSPLRFGVLDPSFTPQAVALVFHPLAVSSLCPTLLGPYTLLCLTSTPPWPLHTPLQPLPERQQKCRLLPYLPSPFLEYNIVKETKEKKKCYYFNSSPLSQRVPKHHKRGWVLTG